MCKQYKVKLCKGKYPKKVYLINSGFRINIAFIDLNQCIHISKAASDIFLRWLVTLPFFMFNKTPRFHILEIQKKIFRKIEKLDILNIQLERQGPDIQGKVEELEQLNQAMRDRDKLIDDTIAHLSDQLIALTSRSDSIEKTTELQQQMQTEFEYIGSEFLITIVCGRNFYGSVVI